MDGLTYEMFYRNAYFAINSTVKMYIRGVTFFALPQHTLMIVYEITPIAIPSEMLYIRGMQRKQRYAGIDSVTSSNLISVTAITIRKPTKMSAGAVANPGMAVQI